MTPDPPDSKPVLEPDMKTRLLWAIIALFALFNLFKSPILATSFDALIPLVSIAAPVLFVLLHGPRQIGWARLGLFFG